MVTTPALTADDRADLTAARPAFHTSDGKVLTAARALASLRSRHSLSVTTAIVAATDWRYKPGRTRINVLVTTYLAAPEGVTAAEFDALVTAAGTANRSAGKGDTRTSHDGSDKVTADRSPAGNVTAPTVTVESILLDIALLTPADKVRVLTALEDMALPAFTIA